MACFPTLAADSFAHIPCLPQTEAERAEANRRLDELLEATPPFEHRYDAFWRDPSLPELFASEGTAEALLLGAMHAWSAEVAECATSGECVQSAGLFTPAFHDRMEQLTEQFPEHLAIRLTASAACVVATTPTACQLNHAAALQAHYPANAAGALIAASAHLKEKDRDSAIRLLLETREAHSFDLGLEPVYQAERRLLDKWMPAPLDDEPEGLRAATVNSFPSTFMLLTQLLRLGREPGESLCQPPFSNETIQACEAAARAMELPGATMMGPRRAQRIRMALAEADRDQTAIDRLSAEFAAHQHAVDSVGRALVVPEHTVAYMEDVFTFGENETQVAWARRQETCPKLSDR